MSARCMSCEASALVGDRCCAFHRALFDRVKGELGRRNAPKAVHPKPAPVTATATEASPRRRKAPPRFADKIVEFIREQNRTVSSAELGKVFGVSEHTARRYAQRAKADGRLFMARTGYTVRDHPLEVAELISERGSATAAQVAEAFNVHESTARDWAKRAQARGLIRVENGDRRGYLPAEQEPQGAEAA